MTEQAKAQTQFQSTLPAWGATWRVISCIINIRLFQSTLPAWGATIATTETD